MIIENNVAGVFTLTLNRPELHNAFDEVLIQQLTQVLEKIDQDDSVRVVVLAAKGKSFCAGADVNWMQKMAQYSQAENMQDADALARLMRTLNDLSKPTIALVQGAAFGGGVGLVACCDMAIASTEASFCFSEVKIGLVPAVISPYAIAAIGERAARRYFLTAEKFSAAEAQQLGLVQSVVAPENLIDAGERMAKMLLDNSPQALRLTKQLIAQVANKPIDADVISATVECIAGVRVSPEGQEGLCAFLAKRRPSWSSK